MLPALMDSTANKTVLKTDALLYSASRRRDSYSRDSGHEPEVRGAPGKTQGSPLLVLHRHGDTLCPNPRNPGTSGFATLAGTQWPQGGHPPAPGGCENVSKSTVPFPSTLWSLQGSPKTVPVSPKGLGTPESEIQLLVHRTGLASEPLHRPSRPIRHLKLIQDTKPHRQLIRKLQGPGFLLPVAVASDAFRPGDTSSHRLPNDNESDGGDNDGHDDDFDEGDAADRDEEEERKAHDAGRPQSILLAVQATATPPADLSAQPASPPSAGHAPLPGWLPGSVAARHAITSAQVLMLLQWPAPVCVLLSTSAPAAASSPENSGKSRALIASLVKCRFQLGCDPRRASSNKSSGILKTIIPENVCVLRDSGCTAGFQEQPAEA
ncbi:hypothetical protein H8959_019192 [Pygathrix nigripes]